MKISDLSNKKRNSSHWISFAAASLLAAALAGCGGGGSSETAAVVPPVVVPPPVVAPPAAPVVAAPTGAAPITLTATTSAATFAALTPAVPAVAVSIASAPKVTFSLTDGAGNAIKGFGSKSQSATAAVASYPNLAFSLAKYVPGTPVTGTATRTPGKWVSYIVTGNPTYKSATDKTIVPGVPSRPSTDNTGTLVDNGDGTYTYTFYRDIAKAAAEVAAATLTGANVAADLGDLTYDPNALHRLTIQISGNAPGTGTNTPDGVTVTTAVPMTNPTNAVYDFIPATGKAVAPTDATVPQRLIVDKASCNECHAKLGGIPGTESATFHGGSRYDPKYCVVCHTDQRKYGRTNSTSTNNAFPALTKTVNATTGSVSYSPTTYVADGVTIGDFPVLIHRVHKGEGLKKANYNYANVLLNETRYPQDYRNCTKCHDNTAPKVASQADNWKMVPSRLACGACHDGIDWKTGKGTTNAGGTGGHIGGAKLDDSQCALCHDATSIPVYHIPVTKPSATNAFAVGGTNIRTNAAWVASNRDNLPAGAIKITYDLKSVVRNANKNVEMTFRMLQNGTPQPFNNPATSTEIWPAFMGAPSLNCVWAVPQDGITAPADFNASVSAYLRSIWKGTATGTGAGTLSAIDASGYYKVTLTGYTVPDNAVMLTCGMGYEYTLTSSMPLTQTNLADYPVSASATASTGPAGITTPAGGLLVVTPDVQMVATGYTGRRAIVSDALCNACHLELGIFAEATFHGGQRNDGTTCSWCHTPNRASSGWSADSTNFIHAIHAASKRDVPYNWHGVSATNNFSKVEYPGILSRCETCHVAGTYDFSASASSSALPNRQYRTVATGTGFTTAAAATSVSFSPASYVPRDQNFGTGPSYSTAAGTLTAGAGTNLVISPIAAACFSCHDADVAKQHMESNGASIYRDRTTSLAKAEQCMFCHQPTSSFGLGIKAVHAK